MIIDIYIYLGLPIQKDMIGGVRDTLVNELHVMPLLIRPSLLVTTTTKIKVSFDLYYQILSNLMKELFSLLV